MRSIWSSSLDSCAASLAWPAFCRRRAAAPPSPPTPDEFLALTAPAPVARRSCRIACRAEIGRAGRVRAHGAGGEHAQRLAAVRRVPAGRHAAGVAQPARGPGHAGLVVAGADWPDRGGDRDVGAVDRVVRAFRTRCGKPFALSGAAVGSAVGVCTAAAAGLAVARRAGRRVRGDAGGDIAGDERCRARRAGPTRLSLPTLR